MTRPWISANFAVSADGKITNIAHRPSGWTSKADHRRFLELRKGADALLVGRGTLIADRMTMTVPDQASQPLRCVVSSKAQIPGDHPLFLTPAGPIHVLATEGTDHTTLSGATVHDGSLAGFLDTLATQFSVRHLHCEGGGTLIRALSEMDALDEFHLTLAGHTIFGGQQAPTTTGIPDDFLPKSIEFELVHFEPLDSEGECFLSYRKRS
jgi:5-amino-6-(5-phosphoribosylamino)uracil reductase/2,5-diamino-6-(ribosylamino)-4(3H)-pyrimidinone 5'-phosphate reductase